jgi:hypothetical protein
MRSAAQEAPTRRARDGFANIIASADFASPPGCGHCLQRSLLALEILRRSGFDCQLEIGSMLYRVGPDPIRDVVAFCGPGNVGKIVNDDLGLYHAWVSVGGYIADFSVGEWRHFHSRHKATYLGALLGPIQWTITPPAYWWRPRGKLIGPWRPTGVPELGVAWYGPFTDDLADIRDIREYTKVVSDLLRPEIVATVDYIFEQVSRKTGIRRHRRDAKPLTDQGGAMLLASDGGKRDRPGVVFC